MNRILSALHDNQLSNLVFGFEDESSVDGQDVVLDPVTGESTTRVSLARFTNLAELSLYRCDVKHFKSLQAMLRSWNPIEAPSRLLRLHPSWEELQSVLSREETGSLGQNVSALEESCGSVFSLHAECASAVVY